MNGGSSGSPAVARSGGEAVGSMVDANDERWEKLFSLSAMAVDTSAEWSEGPSAAAGGADSKRRRTGDSDDSDDGEDATVSAQLGARFSMNENIRRAKKRLHQPPQPSGEKRLESLSNQFHHRSTRLVTHKPVSYETGVARCPEQKHARSHTE